MTNGKRSDNQFFDDRTLRMIIGALAFGLPAVVYVAAGRVTVSISASYHEEPARNLFVGLLFVLGALLISYKGHLQGEPRHEGISWWSWFWSWKWIPVYQEDVISTVGGVAALTTALFPTACEKCSMDTNAYIHMVSAFILFANVIYFGMVAFLRSVNRKLLSYDVFEEDAELLQKVTSLRTRKTRRTWNPLLWLWNLLTVETTIFRALFARKWLQYAKDKTSVRFAKVWTVYDKKLARGMVYVVFGSLTLIVLTVYILLGLLAQLNVIPDLVTGTRVTFVIEALSLAFFGVIWMTASKLEYWRQVSEAWQRFRQKQPAAAQPGTP